MRQVKQQFQSLQIVTLINLKIFTKPSDKKTQRKKNFFRQYLLFKNSAYTDFGRRMTMFSDRCLAWKPMKSR